MYDGGVCRGMSGVLTNRKTGYSRAEQRPPVEISDSESKYEDVFYKKEINESYRMYENVFLDWDHPPLLKWKFVDETIKKCMMEHVDYYISRQCEGGIPNQVIFVPWYSFVIYSDTKDCFGNRKIIATVAMKHAILEYMKEKNMMNKPFILSGENKTKRGWTIQYVYMPETS
jgi:hypothetical protein